MEKKHKQIFRIVNIIVVISAFFWYPILRTVTHLGWTRTEISGFDLDFYIPHDWSLEAEDGLIYIYQTTNNTKKVIGVGVLTWRYYHPPFIIESKTGMIELTGGLISYQSNYNNTSQAYAKCNISERCIIAEARDFYLVEYNKYDVILFVFFDPDVSISKVKQFMESFQLY